MERTKEEKDRRLLNFEIVLIVLSVVIILAVALVAALVDMEVWQRIVILSVGVVVAIFLGFVGIKIEQIAGYYVCKECGRKYVPSFSQVFFSCHIGRTRYMQCPECHKRSWHKKVVK